MKKLFLSLLLLVASANLKAFEGFDADAELGFGYRSDEFKINSVNTNLGTALDRRFNDINLFVLDARLEGTTCNYFYGRIEGDGVWGDSPRLRVLDASGPTTFTGRGKDVNGWDWDAVAGYKFSFVCEEYYVIPLIGYGQHQLRLSSTFDGETTRSHYRSTWEGLVVGFKAGWNYDCNIKLYLGYEWQDARHRNRANETLGGVTTSYNFRNRNGNGNHFYIGGNYILCNDFYIGGRFDGRWFEANRGNVTASSGVPFSSRHASWNSYQGTLILGYNF
jgi:hypothetical protein